jgi:putative oxidoreductase
MKYAVWFVRLIFAAWMIPAGLNHFVPLFPQPVGTQPLSQELFYALFNSHLFDLVKLVELVAGIGVLFGYYLPLSLVVCMPVSFCVWYWDTPLEGWGSAASIFGGAVLLCNVLLCLAYIGNYRAMFAWRSKPRALGASDGGPAAKHLVLAGRLIFGAWMLLNGINYFFVPLYPLPVGHEPLAMQLMTGLVHSSLMDVVMAIELVTGALILIGVFVPLALCVVMPISVCAAFWGVILEHRPLSAILALAAIALNGLLMLAYIDYYKGVLQRRALAAGEA